MTTFSSIDIALSGMMAQANRLGTISNNIANSSTVGYKSADTSFESLVLAGPSNANSGELGGVSAQTRMNISAGGQVQNTGNATDIAISGGGFMVVNSSATPGSGSYYVTRAGSFRPDANGNLVNSGGMYLQGQPLDATGNLIGPPADNVGSLQTVNVSNLSIASAPTQTMTFNANLPAQNTAYAITPPANSTTSVQYYDQLGGTQALTFEFVPTVPSNPGANSNTWTMNIYDKASATPAAPVSSATLTFNATGPAAGMLSSVTPVGGSYNAATGAYTITTGDGETLPINIGALNSPGGMTQLDGNYETTNIRKDGSSFGLLQGVSVSNDGKVTAQFSNGASRPIYQLDLAVFPNADGLNPAAGDSYAISPNAGTPRLFTPGTGPAGSTQGGALEGSNVDMTTELTNLIETQRAYSSSASVVQTSREMLDTVNHLVQ